MLARRLFVLAMIGLGLQVAPAHAGYFYQSIPDLTIAPSLPGVCSTCSGSADQWVGESFSLSSTEKVGSVTFTADAQYWPVSSVTISIFNDFGYFFGNYLVGSQIYSQNFSPPFASNELLASGPYLVTVGLGGTGPTLVAGNYIVFLTNATDLALPAYSYTYPGAGKGVYVSGPLGQGSSYLFEGSGRDWAVALSGVPEVPTWAMLAIGFAGFVIFGHGRSRRYSGAAVNGSRGVVASIPRCS